MIIFQNEKVIVEFDQSVPCICWIPQGYIDSDSLRDSFGKGIDYLLKNLKDKSSISWLNDTRKLSTLKMEDTKWIDEYVNEKCHKAGVRKVAFVLPDSPIGKIAVRTYTFFTMKKFKDILEIKAFEKIEDAKAWLQGSSSSSTKEIRLAINQTSIEKTEILE